MSGNLQSGIISFRKLSDRFKTVKVGDSELLSNEVLLAFEEQLKLLIEEIYNPKIAFKQTTDLNICEYCSYKMICNR